MDDDLQQQSALPEAFGLSATPAAQIETVTLPIDADIVAWLRADFPDWQGHINDLLRFYMDTSADRTRSFDPDAFEPGDTTQDPPLPFYELEFP